LNKEPDHPGLETASGFYRTAQKDAKCHRGPDQQSPDGLFGVFVSVPAEQTLVTSVYRTPDTSGPGSGCERLRADDALLGNCSNLTDAGQMSACGGRPSAVEILDSPPLSDAHLLGCCLGLIYPNALSRIP
jgi:hypothetical protein